MSFDRSEWLEVAEERSRDDCTPMFYMKRKLNQRRTDDEGRPVFDEVSYVKILIPGQMKNIPDRKVQDDDKKRWPAQWAAFERGQEQAVDGTRVEEWPYLTHELVAHLKYVNVFTIEQVAGMSDTVEEKLGPLGKDLKDRAKDFLSGANETEKRLRSENKKLKEEVKSLQSQLRNLKAGNVVDDAA